MKTIHIQTQHFELADGTSCNYVAITGGTVKITLMDNVGKFHDSILQNTLYIPTYPQNIFSVEAEQDKVLV